MATAAHAGYVRGVESGRTFGRRHDRQAMRDEDVGKPEFLLQFLEQAYAAIKSRRVRRGAKVRGPLRGARRRPVPVRG